MASIRTRLKALEGAARKTANEDGPGMASEIAGHERRACLIVAWVRHHEEGEPIEGVLPGMLRYVDESEARRLLSMGYNAVYSAIGMPHHAAAKPLTEVKPQEMPLREIQVPGGRAR